MLVGGYLAIALLSGGTLPKGASVAGVAIGDLTPQAAESKVRTDLADRASAAVTITGGPVTSTVDPRAAGLSLDVPESVRRAAGGGRFAPARVWREFSGGHDVDAVATSSPKKLDVQVARVAAEIRKPVVEGAIGFDRGKPVPVTPENGRGVSTSDVRQAVLHGFLRKTPVPVDVEVLEPKIGADAVAEAMATYAVPATSGPVELVLGDDDVVAPPDLFTKAITLRPDGDKLEPKLDVDDLFAALEPLMSSVAGAARPAGFAVDGDKPTVVPSKKGVTFDPADLRSKFLAASLEGKGQRLVKVKGVTSQPSFTTADAQALN
ncbi:MAG: VanW family protein, partial [Nocardioidaceae bacterium]|nr:VanW family protein [Nocardioidaceae bacterium]